MLCAPGFQIHLSDSTRWYRFSYMQELLTWQDDGLKPAASINAFGRRMMNDERLSNCSLLHANRSGISWSLIFLNTIEIKILSARKYLWERSSSRVEHIHPMFSDIGHKWYITYFSCIVRKAIKIFLRSEFRLNDRRGLPNCVKSFCILICEYVFLIGGIECAFFMREETPLSNSAQLFHSAKPQNDVSFMRKRANTLMPYRWFQ